MMFPMENDLCGAIISKACSNTQRFGDSHDDQSIHSDFLSMAGDWFGQHRFFISFQVSYLLTVCSSNHVYDRCVYKVSFRAFRKEDCEVILGTMLVR